MRILHADSGKQMRGGQWQALYLAVAQKSIGLDPLLLTPTRSPLRAEAEKRHVAWKPLTLWTLRQESKSCSVTHVHDARSHTMAALASQSPLVVSRRVGFPIQKSILSRWKYERAARFLAISEFVARQLLCAGIPEAKIAIVYDGVPLEARALGGASFVIPASDDPRKCIGLARLAARTAGVSLVESANLSDDLATARALLYLTEMEGLGSAALLAMGAGVPVIASRVGGLPEIVREGATGILVDNDVQTVASALRRLSGDEELARKLGTQARTLVTEHFTLAHMALRTFHEYRKVAK